MYAIRSYYVITKKYYEYIIKTLNYDSIQFDIIVPSLMNINNQILTDQISKLIELQSQKNNLKINSRITSYNVCYTKLLRS